MVNYVESNVFLYRVIYNWNKVDWIGKGKGVLEKITSRSLKGYTVMLK